MGRLSLILHAATSPAFSLYEITGEGRLHIIDLSEVTSPQMQTEPLEQLQIGGDMVKAQAEVLNQVAEEI